MSEDIMNEVTYIFNLDDTYRAYWYGLQKPDEFDMRLSNEPVHEMTLFAAVCCVLIVFLPVLYIGWKIYVISSAVAILISMIFKNIRTMLFLKIFFYLTAKYMNMYGSTVRISMNQIIITGRIGLKIINPSDIKKTSSFDGDIYLHFNRSENEAVLIIPRRVMAEAAEIIKCYIAHAGKATFPENRVDLAAILKQQRDA